jgi:hypothetical protein
MRRTTAIFSVITVVGLVALLAIGTYPHKSDIVATKLIDTGWQVDSRYGEGVFMTFEADTLPGLDATGGAIGQELCNSFVAHVVPFVLGKTGKANPAFVMLTIRRGNDVVGTYWRTFYRLTSGKCGAEL